MEDEYAKIYHKIKLPDHKFISMFTTMEEVLLRIGLFLNSNRSILRCQSRLPWAKDSHNQISEFVLSFGYDIEEVKLSGSQVHSCRWHSQYTTQQRVMIVYWYMFKDEVDLLANNTATKYIFVQTSIQGPLFIEPSCRFELEFHPERWKYLYDDEHSEFYMFHLVLLRWEVHLDHTIRSRILHHLRYTQKRCRRGRDCLCRGEATACSSPPPVMISCGTDGELTRKSEFDHAVAYLKNKRQRLDEQ